MSTETTPALTAEDFTTRVTQTTRGPLNVRTLTRGTATVRMMDRDGHPMPWSASPQEWAARNVALYVGCRLTRVMAVSSMEAGLAAAADFLSEVR